MFNVGNKTANINEKTCQFKTWCKGDKSNIENSTDHWTANYQIRPKFT